MDQKIYNKGITIQEISMKSVKSGNRYVLKDHEGKTFGFFTTKQDGSDTQAFAQFKSMDLRVGNTVTVGYVEDEFEVNDNGVQKSVISKKIISFRELNGEPSQTALADQTGRGGAPRASQETFNRTTENGNDAYGRRLALHGFVNGMLAGGATVETIARDIPALLRLEDTIEKALSEVRPVSPITEDELPVIQQEEINVEDIPY